MKISRRIWELQQLAALGAIAISLPLWPRSIRNIGSTVMSGDLNEIASWTYAAFAYGAIHASNSTSELTALCAIANETSSRYFAAFPDPDVAKFARDAVCDASKVANPSPIPIDKDWNNLFFMKSYLAGVFTAQSYYGDKYNSSYAANLCWYVESILIEGLWAPTPDAGHGFVDAESSFCATSGYYGKDTYFQYTNATQTAVVVAKVNELVTLMMARVLQVVLKSADEIDYVCTNFGRWQNRIDELGIVSDLLKKEVCNRDREVKDLAEARKAQLIAMTELFSFQILHAGNAPEYPQWLCDALKKDGFAKVGLDGSTVVGNACLAVKGL